MCHSGLASYQVSRTRTAVAGPSAASVGSETPRCSTNLRAALAIFVNRLRMTEGAMRLPSGAFCRSFKGLLIALDVGDVLADCRGNAFKVIFRVGGQRSVL